MVLKLKMCVIKMKMIIKLVIEGREKEDLMLKNNY
jgi:hypothetical protein